MSQSKLFLHDHPASSYAQKVRMALRVKGIPFDKEVPDGLGSGEKLKSLSDANPRVEVPALIDGDFKIFDSKVILQYLEEQYPEHPLLPKDPKERAEARMIEEVCDTAYEAINWGMGEINWAKRATGELAEKLHSEAKAQTTILIEWLTEKLGDNKYFGGDALGYADICVAPYVNRSFLYENGPFEGSALFHWRERMLQNPHIKQTSEEMQAATQKMKEGFAELFKAGAGRRREYRDHRLEFMIKSGGFGIVEKGLKEGTIRFSWPGGI